MKLLSLFLGLLVMESASISCLALVLPLDCSEVYNLDTSRPSGVYTIFPVGATSVVQVYCDMRFDGYRLRVSGFSDGGAGDALSYHSGQKFSTFDKDQDSWERNCARSFLGAFWYKYCHYANPNGVYRWGDDGTHFAVGVEWHQWKGYNYSLKSISMNIRPVQ